MGAVERGRELLLVGGRAGGVIRRRWVVVDLAQRDAVAAPAALISAGIHVVHQDALVEEPVRDEDLAGIFIEIESSDSGRKDGGLLVILLHLRRRYLGPAMPEVPQKFSVAIELDDAVAGRGARYPYVALPIDAQRLEPAGPTWDVIGASPSFENVAVGIELQDLRSEHAAFAARRLGGRAQLIGPRIGLAIQHPDVIVLIHIDVDDLLHAPLVRQRLGPEGI